jgi:Na+-transporting methylmalonyl-CoA/oxaloacetate decarboxylase gamma subunit
MSSEVILVLILLFIVTFFIGRMIFRRFKVGKDKHRTWFAIVFALVVSPIIYASVVISIFLYISYYPSREFNSQVWKTQADLRYEMSEDVIESEMLIGKTQEEILLLLGRDYSSINESRITYELGYVPGLFNIDPDFLEIQFKNGVAIAAVQYTG